jgi:phage terminase Nu1 subunit (DNA packaging protein)
MKIKCADYKKLSSILSIKKSTIQKIWRIYPHYFVTNGRNLKSARFDIIEVIEYLKENNNGIPEIHRKRREVPRPIQTQRKNLQSRCKNKNRRRGVESGNLKTTQKNGEEGDRRFDVFNDN